MPWEMFLKKQNSAGQKNKNTPDLFLSKDDINIKDREQVQKLVEEYNDIFSSTLREEAAQLDPLILKVNEDLWNNRENARPARPQSEVKRKEIKLQVDAMLEMGIIRPSQSAFWSQVILAPKPNGEWRFCIDYRRLNELTESMGWPIPNIEQTLNRIGEKRPKYFAVMDLTKGFFQAPLDENSSKYTAFATWHGLFEWIRVPMGLKGAPSWFQQQIATKVLGGLLHHICELYIDDLIVYGSTIEEFTQNLRLVFERFRTYKILLNPAKCDFLLKEVTYIGYLLDKKGIEMTAEKKQKALDFELPKTYKQLKNKRKLKSRKLYRRKNVF